MAGTIELSPELEQDAELEPERRISLCETLDRVLNTGVVVAVRSSSRSPTSTWCT